MLIVLGFIVSYIIVVFMAIFTLNYQNPIFMSWVTVFTGIALGLISGVMTYKKNDTIRIKIKKTILHSFLGFIVAIIGLYFKGYL